jgi:hypothetical protein
MKLLKFTSILLLVHFVISATQAQSLKDETIANGGTTSTAGNGSALKWTLGELIVGKLDGGSGGSLGHGHQQIHIQQTIAVENIEMLSVELTVYPNPTTAAIHIQIDDLPQQPLQVELFDLNGKQLRTELLQDNSTMLSVENLPNGTYVLNIKDKLSQAQKSYKIVKQ